MPSGCAFAHNHHNNVLAVAKISIPAGEQFCTAKADTAADLIRSGQRFFNQAAVLRQKLRMPFRNMTCPLFGQLHIAVKIVAGK